jgi:hypothetical protein
VIAHLLGLVSKVVLSDLLNNAKAVEVALREGIIFKGIPGLNIIIIMPEGNKAAYSSLSALIIAVFFDSINIP